MAAHRRAVGRSRLVADLRALGLAGSDSVMVHTRMSAIGYVVGGAQTVVEALLEVVGPSGTLLVLTGWEDAPPYHQDGWDEDERRLFREECPPFDPRRARAERAYGRVPEAVRTWPGARHSRHPAGAFAALGAGASRLVSGQSLDEGYGAGSPLERLVEADGRVLLLGCPLETVTLFHLAEYQADGPAKRWVVYEMPVVVGGRRTWRTIRELDSTLGAFPYEDLGLDEDAFAVITRSALASGIGRSGFVGAADAHLLPAPALVAFARRWMEGRFGARS